MKKTISLLLILFLVAFLFSGCSVGKEYVIATDDSYSPFCYVNAAGEPIGFEIDLLKIIAQEENIKFNIIATGLIDGLEALERNEADGVMASILPTDEFSEKFDFSDPYYNGYAFAVAKGENAQLLKKINEGLRKVMDNGKYQELLEAYALGIADE